MTEIIMLVCSLPAQFENHPDKSPNEVVQMLKLGRRRNEVSPEKILAYLKENTHLLELWLRWSEDKRWSLSWYFTKREPNWVLGKVPNGPELVFNDPIQACSCYVEIELDYILSRQ